MPIWSLINSTALVAVMVGLDVDDVTTKVACIALDKMFKALVRIHVLSKGVAVPATLPPATKTCGAW